jgi:hypothetical protein
MPVATVAAAAAEPVITLRRVIRIEPPEMVSFPALESFQMKAFISFSTRELYWSVAALP